MCVQFDLFSWVVGVAALKLRETIIPVSSTVPMCRTLWSRRVCAGQPGGVSSWLHQYSSHSLGKPLLLPPPRTPPTRWCDASAAGLQQMICQRPRRTVTTAMHHTPPRAPLLAHCCADGAPTPAFPPFSFAACCLAVHVSTKRKIRPSLLRFQHHQFCGQKFCLQLYPRFLSEFVDMSTGLDFGDVCQG